MYLLNTINTYFKIIFNLKKGKKNNWNLFNVVKNPFLLEATIDYLKISGLNRSSYSRSSRGQKSEMRFRLDFIPSRIFVSFSFQMLATFFDQRPIHLYLLPSAVSLILSQISIFYCGGICHCIVTCRPICIIQDNFDLLKILNDILKLVKNKTNKTKHLFTRVWYMCSWCVCVETRGQLSGVTSYLPLCKSQGLNLVCQAGQQAPLPAEPSCQPWRHLFKVRDCVQLLRLRVQGFGTTIQSFMTVSSKCSVFCCYFLIQLCSLVFVFAFFDMKIKGWLPLLCLV